MNCQNIAHLIDCGKHSALTNHQRSEAESHARSCSHCAPLWMAHSRIHALPVPPMPQELSVRCRTLAASPAVATIPRHASRRVMVVTGSLLVVAAAAAAMLASNYFSTSVPARPASAIAMPEAPAVAAPEPRAQPVNSDARTELAPSPVAKAPQSASQETNGLPLLPAPLRAVLERTSRLHLATRKAVELYPQMVQGPEIDGQFVVAIALRPDGTVLSSVMEIATDAKSEEEIRARLTKSLMTAYGSATSTGTHKGALLPDGSVFRGDVSMTFSLVSNDFDPTQSQGRVQEIVRAERAHLMLPASVDGLNFLTVFLAADGSIEREQVEMRRPEELLKQADKPEAAAGYAQEVATRLGLGLDRIGVAGFTFFADPKSPQSGADSNAAATQKPKALAVLYAWQRRLGEVAPTTVPVQSLRNAGIDTAAALVIVERMLPEVFTHKDRPLGQPTVVLTSEGRFIRAGYVKMEDMHLQMQNLEPGRVTLSSAGAEVVNSAGQRATVQLIWQYTEAEKDELEKARLGTP